MQSVLNMLNRFWTAPYFQ